MHDIKNLRKNLHTFNNKFKDRNINFNEARALGADYVISKYSILNEKLELICEKCNDSPELFLYKIKI